MLGNKKTEPTRRHSHSNPSESDYSFRRSRTIVGSAHSGVRAASEAHGQLKSTRLQEHELRKRRRKLSVFLLFSLAVVSGLGYLLSEYTNGVSEVRIKNLVSAGTEYKVAYKGLAEQYLAEYPFERFRFALNTERFSKYMQDRRSEIASSEITRPTDGIGVSDLEVDIRKPIAQWRINSKPYYVASDGVVFENNLYEEPVVSVIDQSSIGSDDPNFISLKLLRFIGRVVTLVEKDTGYVVESVTLPSGTIRQVDLKIQGRPYTIKAHTERDPVQQATDIVNTIKYVTSKGITPQYLDVRIAGKAYYR